MQVALTNFRLVRDFAGDGITVAIPLLRLESKPSAKESELGRKRSALTLSLRVAIRKGVNQEPDDDCNGFPLSDNGPQSVADVDDDFSGNGLGCVHPNNDSGHLMFR